MDIVLSSIHNPIGFFHSFFETNYIDILRADFMPDAYDPSSWIHKFPHDIDQENESYTIEYEVEVSGHEEEVLHGYPDWITDEYKWESKTCSFKEYLSDIIKQEYGVSKHFLGEAIKEAETELRAKHLCRVWIDELLFYRRKALTEEKYVKYHESPRPIEALIRYLLQKYPSYCPEVAADSLLQLIRDKKWGEIITEHLPIGNVSATPTTNESKPKAIQRKEPKKVIKKELLPTFFTALSDYVIDGEYLFQYENDSDEKERRKVAQSLNNISQGYPHNASVSVKFKLPAGPSHYILKIIQKYCSKMIMTELESSGKVFILDRPFKAGNNYTTLSRYLDNPDEYKKHVDRLVKKHLK